MSEALRIDCLYWQCKNLIWGKMEYHIIITVRFYSVLEHIYDLHYVLLICSPWSSGDFQKRNKFYVFIYSFIIIVHLNSRQ